MTELLDIDPKEQDFECKEQFPGTVPGGHSPLLSKENSEVKTSVGKTSKISSFEKIKLSPPIFSERNTDKVI